jgi:hypothetical protein
MGSDLEGPFNAQPRQIMARIHLNRQVKFDRGDSIKLVRVTDVMDYAV